MDTPWQILLIRIFNFACMLLNVTRAQAIRTLTYTAQSLKHEEYYFFEGQDVPVRAADYTTRAPGTATVSAVYNRDTNTLVVNGIEGVPTRKFQFTEVGLYHGSICLHDLTEFFESLNWKNEGCAPPLRMCVGVWSLHSKMFLDRSVDFVVRIVDSYDEVIEFALFGQEDEAWNDLTRVLPSFRELGLIRNIVSAPAPAAQAHVVEPVEPVESVQPAEPLEPLGLASELVEELEAVSPVLLPFPVPDPIVNSGYLPLLYPGQNNLWYHDRVD